MRRAVAAIVVAHPDDETLWLSSAIASARRVVFCFGALFERPRDSRARERAVAAMPLPGLVNLAIPESGAGPALERPIPELTAAGIRIEDAATRTRYESNYVKLFEALRTTLAGFREIYTHNPWGEYGHPEHIQVYRAVAALQPELRYAIWFSNYVGGASWALARRLAGEVRCTERRIVQPDRQMARTLMRVYRQHGAWTWSRAHRWPAEETLFCESPIEEPASRRSLSGVWLLDVGRLRAWSPPWPTPRRRLPLFGQSPGSDGDVHPPPLPR